MSRVSMLAGVCILLALGTGPTHAQTSPAGSLPSPSLALTGMVVTCPQNVTSPFPATASDVFDPGWGLSAGRTPVSLRSYRLSFDTDRPGMNPVPVAPATDARDALLIVPSRSLRHRGPGVTLMVVGVAGVLTGALLNEGIVTLVGAGVGLYGLYLYVR